MRLQATWAVLLLLAGCTSPGGGGGDGAPLGTAPDIALAPFLSSGLARPVYLTHAGDGSGRLFILEQEGIIRVWDGSLRSTPFLDLAAGGTHPRVSDRASEQGLLGLAFHPDYEANGRFFVYYTEPCRQGSNLILAEYGVADPDDDVALYDERRILSVPHCDHGNHNGGMIAFGPDGYLYVGLGDGGSGGDPDNNAQDIDRLLGKILRLDVDAALALTPYTIPPGNPFTGGAGRDEVWAYGLRNPWRFSFDRGSPQGERAGDLWLGDVGQNAWEEIDHERAGAQGSVNYGWSRFEGSHTYNAGRQAPGAVGPVAEYDRDDGGGSHCSVTGGYVYRGDDVPALRGLYVFGDFCSGFLWTLAPSGDGWTRALALRTNLNISSFGEGEDGALYLVDHGGDVRKIVAG